MTSYLQKLRHIFSSSRLYFIAYCFRCVCSRGLKLDSINKWDLGNLRIELWRHNLRIKALSKVWKITTLSDCQLL